MGERPKGVKWSKFLKVKRSKAKFLGFLSNVPLRRHPKGLPKGTPKGYPD